MPQNLTGFSPSLGNPSPEAPPRGSGLQGSLGLKEHEVSRKQAAMDPYFISAFHHGEKEISKM